MPPIAPSNLSGEFAGIAHLPVAQARSRLLAMTGQPPSPELSNDLLRRMLCHRLQEQVLGGLDRQLTVMLDQLADGRGAAPAPRLKPGCVLVREHGGVLHQVSVEREGYRWQGQLLPSLSAVALAITGTSWIGRRFFGLDRSRHPARSAAVADGRARQCHCSDAKLTAVRRGEQRTAEARA